MLHCFKAERVHRYLQDCGAIPANTSEHETYEGACTGCTNKPTPEIDIISNDTRCASESVTVMQMSHTHAAAHCVVSSTTCGRYVESLESSVEECAYTCYEANATCATFSYDNNTLVIQQMLSTWRIVCQSVPESVWAFATTFPCRSAADHSVDKIRFLSAWFVADVVAAEAFAQYDSFIL